MNKQLERMEANLQREMDNLRLSMKEDNSEIKVMIQNHLECCRQDMGAVRGRVGKLEGFKNRASGAVALLLVLFTMWKVAG